jgi:hypothetical protein
METEFSEKKIEIQTDPWFQDSIIIIITIIIIIIIIITYSVLRQVQNQFQNDFSSKGGLVLPL